MAFKRGTMNRHVLVTISVLLIACSGAVAQTQRPWYVLGSGGHIGAISGGRVLSGTIGQTVIGIVSTTDGSRLSQGFWLPLADTTVSVDESSDPTSLASDVVNYPNPFSSSTTIRFLSPIEGTVTVRVFNINGELVRTIQTELSLAGNQEVLFDGLSASGSPLGSGTYLYEVSGTALDGNHFRRIQRMTIIR